MWIRGVRLVAWVVVMAPLVGCAWVPEGGGGTNVPDRALLVTLTLADRVDANYYYYLAIDTDDDRTDGPLPLYEGPFWGNGWGTGSMTYFVSYHAGAYGVYRPAILADLVPRSITGEPVETGIAAVSGSPTAPVAGIHKLTVDRINYGAVAIDTAGTVQSAANASFQGAGTLTIGTDAEGRVAAGSIVFTPAETGGRPLTSAEQSAVADLNRGGALLAPNSLSALGLALTLAPTPAAGVQTLTIAPTTGAVTDRFEAYFDTGDYMASGVLYANQANSEGPTPILPGVRFTTGDLVQGGVSNVITQFDVTANYLGLPFAGTVPRGTGLASRQLAFEIDLAQIGDPQDRIDLNFITTDELIFDPEIAGPKRYDGLGNTGNQFVTLNLNTNYTYANDDATYPEYSGDANPAAIDIVDWRIEVILANR
ncbi:MAG TPA: hypothetical protein PLQ54_10705 [Armatimonadota bacterium]|nr:hypothetical protein [Armatimonadota bacterium]